MKNDINRVLVVDVETTGLDPVKCGILSLGAVWLNAISVDAENTLNLLVNQSKTFYIETRVSLDASISKEALNVNGFSLAQCHDENKPTEHEGVQKFMNWVNLTKPPEITNLKFIIFGGMNPHFDRAFIQNVYGTKEEDFANWPFGSRLLDLHSVMFGLFHQSLKHEECCEYLSLNKEQSPHNALQGAISEAKCFYKAFNTFNI